MPSPIADLSYRNYDGPLAPPSNRWWAIARMSVQLAIKKKGIWVWASFSTLWYVILIVMLYVMGLFSANAGSGVPNPLDSIVWKDQFLNAFAVSQMFLLIIALVIGAGTIANDNRANALLVYLSKPCTKLDYLIGKWVGIFLPFFVIALAPAVMFYAYGVMTYRVNGFISQDPWLLPKMVVVATIPGFVHASLCLGISSLFSQGRLAGATYAGMYFMTLFFTKAMQFISIGTQRGHSTTPTIVDRLYYCSIDGMQDGLAKVILGTNGSPLFQVAGAGGRLQTVPAPPTLFILALVFIPSLAGLAIAWNRVRAVEVVG
jgi:ABC-2 type transport system permease protein